MVQVTGQTVITCYTPKRHANKDWMQPFFLKRKKQTRFNFFFSTFLSNSIFWMSFRYSNSILTLFSHIYEEKKEKGEIKMTEV